MFEIGKTYINNNENAGKMIKTPSGRSFYCPKQFMVIKDNGELHNMHVHSYTVIDDRGSESTIDDEDYKSVVELKESHQNNKTTFMKACIAEIKKHW